MASRSPSSMDIRCASSCPGWYAVTSVKWLSEIEVIDKSFTGHYQSDVYLYEWKRDGKMVREPVTLQRVRSLITEPAANNEVERGELAIRGVAWSGAATIAGVEVSIANGPWQQARLVGKRSRHSWQWWELITRLDTAGTTTIRARATDQAGHTQPDSARMEPPRLWQQRHPTGAGSASGRSYGSITRKNLAARIPLPPRYRHQRDRRYRLRDPNSRLRTIARATIHVARLDTARTSD